MLIDITELDAAGRPVALRPAVDLAAAFPFERERFEIRARLTFQGPIDIRRGSQTLRIALSRLRPPKGGAIFAVRLRPKTGPAGAAAHPFGAPVPPSNVDRIVDRIAAVMRRQAAETGACTVRDLRQAGLSYRAIVRHADAAREVIAAAELTG